MRPALVVGGAGFIGTNLSARLLDAGRSVRIFDNLARPGVEGNLEWLHTTYGDRLQVTLGDVRDRAALGQAVRNVSEVYHFAAQVAVTSSLADPLFDFAVNAGGTLNLLQALRALDNPPPVLFTSTNKVYGHLEDIALSATTTRYEPADADTRAFGISEERRLAFHSPYGCSKGAADQYVLEYARTFGLPAVVFRMSCIYGPHQLGNEDQGWVAHFLIRAIDGVPITIYGDGLQVRDLLFVDDLVDAMLLAHANIAAVSGRAFNIGGGPSRTTSLIELVHTINALQRRPVAFDHDVWRAADQRYYVSDTRQFGDATGWCPRVSVEHGVRALYQWLQTGRVVSAVEPGSALASRSVA
jgi:CDP-paratose 2-epimerase